MLTKTDSSTTGNAFHRETHYPFSLQCADGAEDFLGKGNHKPAEQAQEALRALACVMALDRHTHLHNAPAEDNDADGLDRGKDEVGQIVDHGNRIGGGGKGGGGEHGDADIGSAVVAKAAVVSMVTQTVSILQRQKKSFTRLDIDFFIQFPPM